MSSLSDVSVTHHTDLFLNVETKGLDELLKCVGAVCNVKPQGYAAEMDNPAMAPLIPSTLLSKKDILFGNMFEIYQFHKRFVAFRQLN